MGLEISFLGYMYIRECKWLSRGHSESATSCIDQWISVPLANRPRDAGVLMRLSTSSSD